MYIAFVPIEWNLSSNFFVMRKKLIEKQNVCTDDFIQIEMVIGKSIGLIDE